MSCDMGDSGFLGGSITVEAANQIAYLFHSSSPTGSGA